MNTRIGLVGLFTLLFCLSTAWAKSSAKESKAIQKAASAIDSQVKSGALTLRYFAALSAAQPDTWAEFPTEAAQQAACAKGYYGKASAYFKGQTPVLAVFDLKSPTKEWVHYFRCYYRDDGTLQKIHSDFRRFGAYQKGKGDEQQFLVKVIRDRYYGAQGKVIKKSAPRFFNTSTGAEVRDVVFKDAAWPLYPTVAKLPFYALMQPLPTPIK